MDFELPELPPVVIAGVVLGLGVMVCFFGYRLFKVVLGLLGFCAGAIAGGGFAMLLTSGAQGVILIVSIITGILGAVILVYAFYIGVFLVGAVGGTVIGGALSAGLDGWVETLVIIGLAILGGVLALKLQKIVLGISTAVIGAAMIAGAGLVFILGQEGATELVEALMEGRSLDTEGWITLGGWALFTIIGSGIQLSGKSKKSKKDKKD